MPLSRADDVTSRVRMSLSRADDVTSRVRMSLSRADDTCRHLAFLAVVLLLLLHVAHGQEDVDTGISDMCESGYFGANCTGVCHCLNGPSVCDVIEGICMDYRCDRGWNDSPYCQTECIEGFFGANCEVECHCMEGDTCNNINGLCGQGYCHSDWTGPGCQLRLPKLTTPPVLENITCASFYLVWSTWTETVDIGDPPVGPYTVQRSLNFSAWQDILELNTGTGDTNIAFQFTDVDPYTFYEFRIRINRLDDGKPVPGVPGPKSAPPVRPLEECIVPTTASPTTSSTTTTTQTTTTTETPTTTTSTTSTTTSTTTTPTTTTTTLPPPPSQVTNIDMELDGLGSVLISWTPPSAPVVELVSYNATYQVIGAGNCNDTYREPEQSLDVAPTDRRVTLTGLIPWRKYAFRIAAANVAGYGDVMEATFYSREIAPSSKVTNVQAVRIESTSVQLTWDNVTCLNRGGILKSYDVFIKKDEVTLQLLTSQKQEMEVTGLIPYSDYIIQIRYVNSAADGPLSDDVIIRTLQDVPASPGNPRIIETTSTRMLLTWDTPVPSNGIITHYRVIYWRTGVEGTETTLTLNASNGTQTQITGLTPFRSYNIRIQARSQAAPNDGWGTRSATITHMTADGQPSQPVDLRRTSRNESSISLAWDRPGQENGLITKYKVSYRVVAVQSISNVDVQAVEEEVSGATLTYQASRLVPAAQYRFHVQASTTAAYGDSAAIDIWTEVGIPDIPPTPVVRDTTWSNITIRIQPVVLTRGPVSGYFIVVDKINEKPDQVRAKRSVISDPVQTIPLPGVTVAFLERDAVRVSRNFVVGDGETYGDYFNDRLTPSALYNIYFIVVSSLDGTTKMSFSQIQAPVRAIVKTSTTLSTAIPTMASTTTTTVTSTATTTTTTTTQPPTTTTTPEVPEPSAAASSDDDNTIIIIAIVVPLIVLLIIVVVVVLLCCWKKRKQPKDELKSSWLDYYTTHYYDPASKNTKGNWSDIYNLKEPRHVTVNEKASYMPDDLKVAEIHHNNPKLSFEEEYKNLIQGKKFPWVAAEKPENSEKNRFEHLLPYDQSRVILRQPQHSDYINASYISGYDSTAKHMYIAAQSPFNDETIGDFWLMVYQERSSQIIFLANLEEDGIVKSEQYWPEDRTESQYHRIIVRLLKSDYYANFIVRTFELQLAGRKDVRRVCQYHFTNWPDHGVPEDPIPFLEFRMKVRTSEQFNTGGPITVHCGTGVSRTAVFIAIDSLLEQAKYENCVNVFKFCNKMRKSRTFMVRTLKQYKFIYDALLEALLTNYNIVGEDLKVNYRLLSKINPITDKSLFREQFEILEEFTPLISADKCQAALSDQNLTKNRFKSIVPPDEYRPVLHTPGGQSQTDYINAFFVDSYTLKSAFIVTQTPLSSTVVDFWKLVYDYDINCIVMLNNSDFKEDTCAEYIPHAKNLSQKYDPFFVRLDDIIRTEHATVRSLQLTNATRPNEPPRIIRQFQFESWKMYEKTPWSREGFIKQIEMVNDWLGESDAGDIPVLVHCMDGASQSGLFCACSVVCEKMLLEDEVDVFHTVKHMKRRRKHFINSLEQYKFCFKLLWDYMNTRISGYGVTNDRLNLGYAGSSQEI